MSIWWLLAVYLSGMFLVAVLATRYDLDKTRGRAWLGSVALFWPLAALIYVALIFLGVFAHLFDKAKALGGGRGRKRRTRGTEEGLSQRIRRQPTCGGRGAVEQQT